MSKCYYGKSSYSVREFNKVKLEDCLPEVVKRADEFKHPSMNETQLERYLTKLSKLNFGVGDGIYPLGSCTMKYNPKINEQVASLNGFANAHPCQEVDDVQGTLQIIYEMQNYLAEITGMDACSLQPAAGAHGEFTSLMMIRQKHLKGKSKRKYVLIPDSAHGTNPASVAFAGYKPITIKSDDAGNIDLKELDNILLKHKDNVAAMMITNPNTLGLFDKNITSIVKRIHDAGGLLFYDGANLNATMGISRPGKDMGFDVLQLNLHKTFSTPHGGGGPGSGPVCCKKSLEDFLPSPVVKEKNGRYYLKNLMNSIGKVRSFYGNAGVVLKAYTYIRMLGSGLKKVSETAILNANYLMNGIKDYYEIPFARTCMHEFVVSDERQKKFGVKTLDIAKRLMDYGFHPPTIYFPLIVPGALMFEPTETASKKDLDNLIEAMVSIAKECENEPEKVTSAPHNTKIGRLDEVLAARKPILKREYD